MSRRYDISVHRKCYADVPVPQLHSELVRTTIMKDFVDFYGVSKYVDHGLDIASFLIWLAQVLERHERK